MRSRTGTLKFWLQCFWRGLREWCGDAAYDRYLNRAAKSGAPHPLTPAEFYVEQTTRRYSRPNRCCCLVLAILAASSLQESQKPALQPLTRGQVLVWMDSGEESRRVAQLVERQGIDFQPNEEFLEGLRRLHAKPELLETLKKAPREAPSSDPALEQAAYSHLLACLENPHKEATSGGNNECQAAESGELTAVQFALGTGALSVRNFAAAQKHFKEAIEAGPLIPDTHNYLGLAFQRAGDLQAAETEYREAVRLDPDYETPVSNLASLFLDRNDPERAESYARHAVVMPYASATAHNNLGLALIKQSKAREGMAELFEAERLQPDSPNRHTQIAEMLLAGRVYELALQEYRQAAQLDPGSVNILKRILQILLVLRREDEARSTCERFSKLKTLPDGRSCKDLLRSVQTR